MVYDVGRPFYFRPVSKVCITAFPFFNRAYTYFPPFSFCCATWLDDQRQTLREVMQRS